MVVRELINRVGWEVDQKSLTKAEQRIQSFKKGLKFAAVGVAAAVAGIGAVALKTAADIEMLETQFEVMLGSAEKAAGLMEELKEFSAATPFALEDLAQGTQTLLSFGVAQEDVLDTMRMLGDTAGGNREKLNGLILAFGKVQTKGKVSMEEINMIAERGVPIIGTLTEQLGVTEQQFFKLVSAGKIGRKEIQQAFRTMTSEGGMFFQGMQKQSLTFAGMLSTMKDNLKLAAAAIGETLLPTAKELIGTITTLVQGPLGELIKELAGALKPILEVLGPLLGTLSEVLVKLAKPLTVLIKFIADFISRALTPLSKILMVVADLIGELIGTGLVENLQPVTDVLILLLEVLAEILLILNPLLKVWIRFSMALNARVIRVMVAPFKLLLIIIRELLRTFRNVGGILLTPLRGVLEKIQSLFETVWNNIKDFFDNIWNAILKKIAALISWVNKVPGIDIRLPKIDDAADKATQKLIQNNQKQTNIQMKANVQQTFTGGAGPDGRGGLTAAQTGQMMKNAAQAAFSLELRKLIVSAA